MPGKALIRRSTGIAEFDRALGGGLVPGSAILMGGDPGIGKSTLLLQASAKVAQSGGLAVYISGEEATGQIRLRAERLGVASAPIRLAASTSVRDILTTLGDMDEQPALLVIDRSSACIPTRSRARPARCHRCAVVPSNSSAMPRKMARRWFWSAM
jgi:DNA repair protein RadA/Sms